MHSKSGDKSSKLTKLTMPMEEELTLPVAPQCQSIPGRDPLDMCSLRHNQRRCEERVRGKGRKFYGRPTCKWVGGLPSGGRKSRKKKRRKGRKKKKKSRRKRRR